MLADRIAELGGQEDLLAHEADSGFQGEYRRGVWAGRTNPLHMLPMLIRSPCMPSALARSDGRRHRSGVA
jgi:hypothetical protein